MLVSPDTSTNLPSYESIKTVTVPTSKDGGTFGGMSLNSTLNTTW